MVAVKIDSFGGMIPALDARLLPQNAAVLAENCMLESGAIIPLPKPVDLHTNGAGIDKAYRLPDTYSNPTYFPDSTWMEFTDPDTDVIRSPVFDDTYDRYYWTSPTLSPRYNTRARIENGDPEWLLGIPAPASAPSVAPSGGASTTLVTRSYVYTYVSAYGEEGPPSAPQTDTDKIDATWALTVTAPVANDQGVDRNLTHINIYRTITGADGIAVYYLVQTLALPTVAYNDTLSDADVALNAILPSTTWTAPPTDLQGFVLMPNGALAAWRGNPTSEVWFSEPYRPHAWPASYVQTVEYPIVGMAMTNQTLVVCTQAYPMTFQGVAPAFMTPNKLTTQEPCISRGSILGTPEGVYYASPNGLILVVPGDVQNITKDLISKRDWNTLLPIAKLRAARLGMSYFAYGSATTGVFQEDAVQNDAFQLADDTGSLIGVIINPSSQRIAFSMLEAETAINCCYNDPWTGEVFLVTDGKVKYVDLVSNSISVYTATWRSRIFQTNELKNFKAAKIFYDSVYAETGGNFLFYADGRLVLTRPLPPSGSTFLLPSGYKADYAQFEITSKVRVLSIQFGTSVKELAGV